MSDRITAHFSLSEFACNDGTPVPDEYRSHVETLAVQLEALRAIWGVPIQIISGYRTPEWNERVEGSKNSLHLTARAADIKIAGQDPEEVAKVCEEFQESGAWICGGVGLYPDRFVHVDTRGTKARWRG